ncbi:hypothetical protein, partial, partial [Parasitella parasitica]
MFTRWPLAVATRKADAITAATFLYEEVFTKFGPITTLLSDNGSHFANQVLEKYVVLCNAKHKFGISPSELLFGVVPVDAERDSLLAFDKTLGFDRLLALPELRNEAILKDARERSKMPAVDYVRFLIYQNRISSTVAHTTAYMQLSNYSAF